MLLQPEKLTWLDVLEITICLNVYGKLPEVISQQELLRELMTISIHRWRNLFTDIELSRTVSTQLMEKLKNTAQVSSVILLRTF